MGISQTAPNCKMLYNISSKARNRKFLGSKNEPDAVTAESQKANLAANRGGGRQQRSYLKSP